ncbi:MAG: hypothetical protein RL166_303 [Actinomycetota bacterium]
MVAGVSGSLGRFLAQQLISSKHEVIGISRTDPNICGLTFISHDLRNPIVLPELRDSLVINSAAVTRDGFNQKILQANKAIAATCLGLSAGPQILVSSSSVYDLSKPTNNAEVSDANGQYAFLNSYSQSKFESELIYDDGDHTSIVLRPHALIGPGDGTLLPRLRKAMRGGRLFLPSGGTAKHEFTSFRNFSSAVELAIRKLENGWTGKLTLNVSDGIATSIADAIRFALSPETVEIRSIPVSTALAIGRLSEVFSLPGAEPRVSRYAVSQLAFDRSYDLEPTKTALGYDPTKNPAF